MSSDPTPFDIGASGASELTQSTPPAPAPASASASASTSSSSTPGSVPVADEQSPSSLLRYALRENAFFSTCSGLVLVLGASRLDTWLGLNTWLLVALGVGLLAFAATLWVGSENPAMLEATGQAAVLGDIAWIVGAIIVIAATSWLTDRGEIALMIVTVIVAVFAATQALGVRRLHQPPPHPTTPA